MVRDFFKDPFTIEELSELLRGLDQAEFLSARAQKYKELDLANRKLSRKQLIDLIVKEPTLLRRPIVVAGDRMVIGLDRPALEAIGSGDG